MLFLTGNKKASSGFLARGLAGKKKPRAKKLSSRPNLGLNFPGLKPGKVAEPSGHFAGVGAGEPPDFGRGVPAKLGLKVLLKSRKEPARLAGQVRGLDGHPAISGLDEGLTIGWLGRQELGGEATAGLGLAGSLGLGLSRDDGLVGLGLAEQAQVKLEPGSLELAQELRPLLNRNNPGLGAGLPAAAEAFGDGDQLGAIGPASAHEGAAGVVGAVKDFDPVHGLSLFKVF